MKPNIPEEIEVKVVRVTPQIANTWLANNNVNRRLDRKAVIRYARDIKADQWQLNASDIICFAPDGQLLNGQHRLNAVVRAGRPAEFFVATNVDPNSQIVMDKGRKRNVSDNLHMFHGVPRKYAAKVSRAARYILVFELGIWDTPNEADCYDVWTRYNDDILWFFDKAPLMPWSKGAYFYGPLIYLHHHAPVETERFLADMATCDRSAKSTVATVVRALATPRLRTGGNKGFEMALRLFNAYSAYIEGRTVRSLFKSTNGYDNVKEHFGIVGYSPETCAYQGCPAEKGDNGLCWIHKNYGNSRVRAHKTKARYEY